MCSDRKIWENTKDFSKTIDFNQKSSVWKEIVFLSFSWL